MATSAAQNDGGRENGAKVGEMLPQPRAWWKEGVCYQVWPLSFKDSNDDGKGDIPGIISKLDYLRDLGVDYIWLSPMYTSPRNDYGYDIADYENVDPTFGTLQDMDDLIKGLRDRGMKLILDLVVNHTSSHHRWFQESMKSRDNKYSNYYIWRDPKIDAHGKKCPPNNWKAAFGSGSAWKYVESRDQYYFHIFLESMPDLNWEDEEVRKAIYQSAIEFWLARGVSGFRVDVVGAYSKNIDFPDAPILDSTEEFQTMPFEHVADGPRMHEWLLEQRQTVLDKFGEDVVLVGELGFSHWDQLEKYLNTASRELDMIFDFKIFDANGIRHDKPFTEWEDNRGLTALREGIMKTQSFISERGWWATTFFENHDQARSISNLGSRDPKFSTQSAKLLALLVASMSGTLFIYQGQEIGMANLPQEWSRAEMRDPAWMSFLEEAEKKYPGRDDILQKAMDIFQRTGRDHARTPVQWSAQEPYAGFSSSTPWIRINDNFRHGVNVEDQEKTPDSLLSFWKELLKFKKQHLDTMTYGDTKFIDNDNTKVMSVIKNGRHSMGSQRRLLVVLNYSDDQQPVPVPELPNLQYSADSFLFGTHDKAGISGPLRPWEGRIFALNAR